MPRWLVVQPSEIVAVRQRDHRSGTREQGEPIERCSDDRLAARLLILAAMKVVPTFDSAREVYAPLAHAGLDNVGHEQIATEHEVVAVGECARIVLEVIEQRAQQRLAQGGGPAE